MTKRPDVIPEWCGRCLYFARSGVIQGRCRFYDVIRSSSSACLAGPEEKVRPTISEEPSEDHRRSHLSADFKPDLEEHDLDAAPETSQRFWQATSLLA
jgi:hypothetical protein